MTKNLLKRLRLAAAIALIPAVGFAENTVPMPNFPDPTAACQKSAETTAAGINASNARAGWPGGFTADDFKDGTNKCIADNQHGYDITRQFWTSHRHQRSYVIDHMGIRVLTIPILLIGKSWVGA
jgi:hypothetical protein